MVLAFIAHGATGTTGALARSAAFAGFEAVVLQPEEALGRLEPGDVALGRLDVLPSLDGVEPGLGVLDADLVGVDMLPTLDGGLVVLELNAAVDFTGEYSLGRDVFADAIAALTARLYTPAREAVQDAIAVPFA